MEKWVELGFVSEREFIEEVQRAHARHLRKTSTRGDAEVLENFVKAYSPVITKCCSWQKDKEDFRSDSWIKIFAGIHTWRPSDAPFSIWISTTVSRVIVDRYREVGVKRTKYERLTRYKRKVEVLTQDLERRPLREEIAMALSCPVTEVVEMEQAHEHVHITSIDCFVSANRDWLDHALVQQDTTSTSERIDWDVAVECYRNLTDNARLALALKEEHGLASKDAADLLGIRPETFDTRVSRARALMRSCYEMKTGERI